MANVEKKLKEDDSVYVKLEGLRKKYISKMMLGEFFGQGDCLSFGDQVNARSIIRNAEYYQSLMLNGEIDKKDYTFLKDSSVEEIISKLRVD
jgi:hypothetical protein